MNILDWVEQWFRRIVLVLLDWFLAPYVYIRDNLFTMLTELLNWVLSLLPSEFNDAIDMVKGAVDVADLFLPVYDCLQLFCVSASVVVLIRCVRWGMRLIPGVVL